MGHLMQAWFRYIAMVLIATLAGGAQACVALCAAPAVAVGAAVPRQQEKSEKSSCHRCPGNAPSEPTPAPEAPCKQCQTATQDRVAAERDHSFAKSVLELSVTPLLDVLPSTTVPPVSPAAVAREPVHPPPGERLHAFCLLLI
jgi:hypothetical protein